MFERDYDTFASLLDDVSELRQIPVLSARAKALFFRAVERYSIDQVRGAIEAHLIDPEAGKFKTHIQPAHIVAQIEGAAANDGRPEADEAWGIALRAQDEAVTVIWTQEISIALEAARPILEAGDDVGARMAFKASYVRAVNKARASGTSVRWLPTLGLDPSQRADVLTHAVSAGLLPAPAVAGLLPAPVAEVRTSPSEAAENIARLRDMLGGSASPAEKMRRAREQAAVTEQARLVRLKRETDAKAGGHADGIWPLADLSRGAYELR